MIIAHYVGYDISYITYRSFSQMFNTANDGINFLVLQELLSLEERLGNVNRGATQDIIEMNTLPYKYKKVSLIQKHSV